MKKTVALFVDMLYKEAANGCCSPIKFAINYIKLIYKHGKCEYMPACVIMVACPDI